jgi:hypothetical protein
VQLLKIHGANLYSGVLPEVRLAGQPVEVLDAQPASVLVRPLAVHDEGQLEVFTDGHRATGWFRIRAANGSPRGTAANSSGATGGTGGNGAAP